MPDRRAVAQQALTVGRHEVRHRPPLPDVAVQPEAAVHRVDHPLAARAKLSIRRTGRGLARAILVVSLQCDGSVHRALHQRDDHWQAGTPSVVAGVGVGDTAP